MLQDAAMVALHQGRLVSAVERVLITTLAAAADGTVEVLALPILLVVEDLRISTE